MPADFSAMTRAICNYIDSKIPKDTNKAQIGTVRGNRVIIGNNSFSFTPTVDMYFGDNSRVACLLPDKFNHAAIVGVL